MLNAYLHRETSDDQGTFGILAAPELSFACFTIELPWMDNQRNVSCIPNGSYLCRWYFSSSFGQHLYKVCDVPDRSGVAIHSGNVAGDKNKGYRSHSLGCPLLGKRRGILWGQKAVLISRLAVGTFFRFMDKQDFNLHIAGGYNGSS